MLGTYDDSRIPLGRLRMIVEFRTSNCALAGLVVVVSRRLVVIESQFWGAGRLTSVAICFKRVKGIGCPVECQRQWRYKHRMGLTGVGPVWSAIVGVDVRRTVLR